MKKIKMLILLLVGFFSFQFGQSQTVTVTNNDVCTLSGTIYWCNTLGCTGANPLPILVPISIPPGTSVFTAPAGKTAGAIEVEYPGSWFTSIAFDAGTLTTPSKYCNGTSAVMTTSPTGGNNWTCTPN